MSGTPPPDEAGRPASARSNQSLRPLALRLAGPATAAAASGLLLALAYPPFSLDGLIWVWAFPLLYALWFTWPQLERRRLYGFGLGYLAGFVFFLVTFSWIRQVSILGSFLLPAYLALFPALWASIAANLTLPPDPESKSFPSGPVPTRLPWFSQSLGALRVAFLTAAVWTALEWLRGWLFTGFGWNGLAVALYRKLAVIQAADLVGVTGLSFIVLFVGTIFFLTARRILLEARTGRFYPHLEFFAAMALLCALILYGITRLTNTRADFVDLRLLLVQLNIPQAIKWDPQFESEILALYEDFTRLYVDQEELRPDLVLWPETALPNDLDHPDNVAVIERLTASGDFNLLFGIQEFDFANRTAYNSAALAGSGLDDVQVYRKIHLVPFGEFLPFRGRFPPFEWVAGHLIPSDFNSGSSTEPLYLSQPRVELIPLICFEDTLGRLARRFVRPAPQLLVNLTNDGWFGESAASEQHMANSLFRCIELRRPMARAANTGVSCVIDADGSLAGRGDPTRFLRIVRDIESGSTFVRGCLPATVRIPAVPAFTLFARWGDWFAAVVSLAGLPAVFRWLRPQRPGTSAAAA
ncbi:MAG TPA: apolipoprotein N-acyltransferase [Verrucomicrobiales bacterium]|nr:apolipoprotein N-acyltransferase [Verrucomicrobiales bacterium]